MDQADKNYREMTKEQRRQKAKRREMGYKVDLEFRCCATCKHVYHEPEEGPSCNLIGNGSSFRFDEVSEIGICNEYEKR